MAGYKYLYCIYDELRRQAVSMWRGALSGKHDGPTMQVRDVGKTLQLRLMQNPIGNNMYINQVPQQDLQLVLREAFCELKEAEVGRYLSDWDFIKIEDIGTGRWNFADLAAEWRKSPLRELERAEIKAKVTQKQKLSIKNAIHWLRKTLWGQIVFWISLGGAIASIVALYLMLVGR